MTAYQEVVAAGAKLLDTVQGNPTWRKLCEGMDISDPDNCIMFRLYGSYSKGLNALGIASGRPYGFDVGRRFDGTNNYDLLQKAWEDEFANPPLGTDGE
jgi:hypothetical protein